MASDRLGSITRRWSEKSPDGVFEYRERVDAIAECPVCHQEVVLLAETDAWTRAGRVPGTPMVRWRHDGYGPAAAEHCGKLIADWWEGTFVYDLEEKSDAARLK